jgi:hypothetical protein
MAEEQPACQAEELAAKAAWARAWSRMLRAETAKVTQRVADTEESVAETLARLALQYPDYGSRLWAQSEAVANQAARKRQRADRHVQLPEQAAADDGAA